MTAASPHQENFKKLGQLLVERGWVSGEQLIRAIQSQRLLGGRIGTCLLEMDVVNEDQLLDTLSVQLRVPAARVEDLRGVDDEILDLVPAKLANRGLVVPFGATRTELKVATLQVRNLALLDELSFAANRRVVPHIASEVRIFEALEKYYGFEIPRRFGHLLDRLNRSRYLWDESAKLLLGETDDADVVWKTPEEAFEARENAKLAARVITAPSARAGYRPLPTPAGYPAEAGFRPIPTPPGGYALEPPAPPQLIDMPTPQRPAAPSAAARASVVTAAMPAATLVAEMPPAALLTQPLPAMPAAATAPAAAPMPAAPLPAFDPDPPLPGMVQFDGNLTLDLVDRLLSEETDVDRIAEIVLRFASGLLHRTALFRVRQQHIVAWQARIAGLDGERFGALEIDRSAPSLFTGLFDGAPFLVAPFAPMPVHRQLAATWGGEMPREVMLIPIKVRDKLVGILYGDRGQSDFEGVDLDDLKRLAVKAAMALELCILRKKLKTV